MKNRKLMGIGLATSAVLVTLIGSATPLAAQGNTPKHSHYRVVDVGTFGGPSSSYNFGSVIINNRGVVVSAADTSIYDEACGCFVAHAFRWKNGVLSDLGTLPGGLGSIADAINSKGSIVGISDVPDPVIGHRGDAALWTHGQIIDLGTLGGPFAAPNDINNREQIVGGGLNTIPDTFGGLGPFLGGTTQTRALLWQDGAMQDLGTLGGNDAFAIFVNEHGQIAGNSYTNTIPNPETGIPTVHPFVWENGMMVDLGTLGGGLYAVANRLNGRGQVAGTSDVTRDQTVQHAFLWERGQLQDLGTFGGDLSFGTWLDEAGGVVGGATTKDDLLFRAFRWKNGHMTNLGSLNGDQCSVAFGGNSKGQVVGNSLSDCDHETHAFLWENGGPMVDLNSFVTPGSGILLREGVFINERGEIAVDGRLANGDVHAFVLVPDDDDSEGSINAVQVSSALDRSRVTGGAPVTPQKVAAFAARFAHRSRGFGSRPK